MTKEEQDLLKGFHFLTSKPVIYIANMSEDEISDPESCAHYQAVVKFAESENETKAIKQIEEIVNNNAKINFIGEFYNNQPIKNTLLRLSIELSNHIV